MAFFDFITGKKSDGQGNAKSKSPKEMARLARLVSDKLAQNYDRQDAIAALSEMRNAAGAEALLRRFDFTMQPSITDQEEKESAVEGIAAAGKDALGPLRAYCAKAEGLVWALKALRKIVPEEELVDEILGILDQFDTDYTRNAEPKIQLISVLEEFKRDDVREAVEPFLNDANESVRFHAVGTLFAMESPEIVAPLIDAVAQEESLRVKNRTAAGLAQRGWEIPEALLKVCAEALPSEFSLRGNKVVRG